MESLRFYRKQEISRDINKVLQIMDESEVISKQATNKADSAINDIAKTELKVMKLKAELKSFKAGIQETDTKISTIMVCFL